ncbi:membrane protein FxsA [Paenibacillus sp. IB182496]|uniref:Membrane protein FxsA n=1 Tax=Paenibacillus sabuli TaxID=2772509 RepID=A0A927BS49_9BACL|nr:FxsA family protein [Paenibacillus sabuli]MBD2844675.1 membrane protein FxsA [Paenibacillus sabuli]
MRRWLLVLAIVLPVIEIWGIVRIGAWLGGWTALLLVLLTAALGAYMMRREGLRVLASARAEMEQGRMPGLALLDGVCVLAGGALLLLPGFLTDLLGLVLLLPPTRAYCRGLLLGWLEARLRSGQITIRRR